MLPSPSLSNKVKASRNSSSCSFVIWTFSLDLVLYCVVYRTTCLTGCEFILTLEPLAMKREWNRSIARKNWRQNFISTKEKCNTRNKRLSDSGRYRFSVTKTWSSLYNPVQYFLQSEAISLSTTKYLFFNWSLQHDPLKFSSAKKKSMEKRGK